MKTLDTQFRAGGFDLSQVARENNVALFSQSKAGHITSFELVIVQVAPPTSAFGRSYPEREVYPSLEQWGSKAWTLPPDRDYAFKRMNSLLNALKKANSEP